MFTELVISHFGDAAAAGDELKASPQESSDRLLFNKSEIYRRWNVTIPSIVTSHLFRNQIPQISEIRRDFSFISRVIPIRKGPKSFSSMLQDEDLRPVHRPVLSIEGFLQGFWKMECKRAPGV